MPSVTDPLAKSMWVSWYNSFVRSFKKNLDQVSTDIPTKSEIIEWGKAAYSWAIDIKWTVVDGIGTTKKTIDTVRGGVVEVQSTYDEARETLNQAQQVIESTSNTLQGVKNSFDDVSELSESITNIVDTEAVSNTIGSQ